MYVYFRQFKRRKVNSKGKGLYKYVKWALVSEWIAFFAVYEWTLWPVQTTARRKDGVW
jgi:hypothetical protein